jgi:hypothetical protein
MAMQEKSRDARGDDFEREALVGRWISAKPRLEREIWDWKEIRDITRGLRNKYLGRMNLGVACGAVGG